MMMIIKYLIYRMDSIDGTRGSGIQIYNNLWINVQK